MDSGLYDFLCRFVTDERLRRFDSVLSQRNGNLTVVLEDVYRSHNASACLRSCDCFGVQHVHVIASRNQFEPDHRISLGAAQWLTVDRYDGSNGVEDCFQLLRQSGFQVLATSPDAKGVSIGAIDVSRPTALVFGAEDSGLSEAAIQQADDTIRIPMCGFTESLNVSVSVAVCLSQLGQRMRDTGAAACLSLQEQQKLRERWLWATLGPKAEALRRRYLAEAAE